MLQDLRYAIRTFLRSPTLAITVIGTIGLALGLNTALFTIFNAYVLRPFAVRDPFSLYQFALITKSGMRGLTWQEFGDLRAQKSAFSNVLAFEIVMARIERQPMIGQRVSEEYFTMLGINAAVGRPLLPEDATGFNSPVVVLNHTAWTNKFGADYSILGKKLVMLGHSYEIVGVAKREFDGLGQVPPDFWVPVTTSAGQELPTHLKVIGRLKSGVTPRQAQAVLSVWARQVTADDSDAQKAVGVFFESSAASIPINQESIAIFAPIVAAFGLVLLIACANVANMMLARGMERQREIGMRLSLGAGALRLVRQLVTESLVLALPAALAGLAISQATIRLAQRLFFSTAPTMYTKLIRFIALAPDFRVFGFIHLAAVASTLVFGLIPAIQTTRFGLSHAARGDFIRNFRPARLRNALVISQVSVCVLLLICAGIMLRGGRQLEKRDVGLATSGVIDVELQQTLPARAFERLKSEPWVDMVAIAWRAPLSGSLRTIPVAPADDAALLRAAYNFVSPEYFAIFRIPVIRGRSFTIDEANSEAAVVMVSEATARLLWSTGDALGQSIRIAANPRIDGGKLPPFRTARVIGVVHDATSGMVWEGTDPTLLYFPTSLRGAQNGSLLTRVRIDPEVARRSLDEILARVVPGLVRQINPMDEFLEAQIYPFRISFYLSSFLGSLALVLTLSGIYGVLSYLVGQRTREIGIRMAIGATKTDMIRLVISQSLRLAMYGIAIGVVCALGVSRVFASQLVLINTFDLLAYALGIAVVLAAALTASYLPSRRAAQIDPASALRYY